MQGIMTNELNFRGKPLLRAIIWICVSLLIGSLVGSMLFGCKSSPVKRDRILSVRWGKEKGMLGFTPRSDETEDIGPSSFFVTENEEIYVLDSVNKRINLYVKGKFVKEIKLPPAGYPIDICVANDSIYVLSSWTLQRITLDGKLIKTKHVSLGNPRDPNSPEEIYKVANVIVALSRSSDGEIECLDACTLQHVSCDGIVSLFKKYAICDVTPENHFFTILDDGTLRVVDKEGQLGRKIGISPYSYLEEELYPMTRHFRVSNNKIYTMEPNRKGISFFSTK